MDAAFGDKTLQKTAIYAIIKKVKAGENTSDQRHLNGKKTVPNAALIASVAAAVERDCRLSVKSFAVAHGVGVGTIHRILHEDLGLGKKSARWVTKGKPGPIKARIHASRTKQMILAFFDNKGLVYSHIVARGVPINVNYIVKVLGFFIKQLKKKQPAMVAQK